MVPAVDLKRQHLQCSCLRDEVLLDGATGEIYAARDPIGVNSLYMGTGPDGAKWCAPRSTRSDLREERARAAGTTPVSFCTYPRSVTGLDFLTLTVHTRDTVHNPYPI